MAMTSWSGNSGDRNPTFERKEGASVTGLYTGKRSVTTKIGPANLYTIEQPDHTKIDLWSCKILDDFFGAITVGTEVDIKYLGKKKTEGGKTFHSWDLKYDKDTMPQTDIESEAGDILDEI